MKNMRKMIATILVFMCSLSCINCMSVCASENGKIDEELKIKIETLSDDEKVPVAIWYKDLDVSNVNDQICEKLNKSIDMNKISKDTLNLFKLRINDKSISRKRLKVEDIDENVSTRDGSYLNKVIRANFKSNYTSYFQNILSKFENILDEKSIIFASHYSPYFQAKLTKSQIEDISKSNLIEEIVYFDSTKLKFNTCSDTDVSTVSSDDQQTENLTATGIKKNIDDYNLTGAGVTVGIIDDGFSYQHLNMNFSRINYNTNVYGEISTNGTHGDYTSAIIGANNANFKGAVSDCNMYFAKGSPNYTESLEWLVDKGCNVINSSFLVGNSGANVYDGFGKWLDSVSQRANVTVVLSSGNSGENSVCGMAMAYNPIVVGTCNNNGVMNSCSSYVNESDKAYKPDIAAQGDDAVSYTVDENTGLFRRCSVGGTSSAAPLVTSAVVQLCQYSSLLMNNPLLVKSTLLNGTAYIGEKNQESSIGDFNAYDRQSGAGILNAYDALKVFRSMNFFAHTLSNEQTSFESSLVVTSAKKTVRITACYQKSNYAGSDVTSIPGVTEVPLIGLEVTVTYTGLTNHTYYSRSFTDNKVSVVFDPPKKGTYKIVVHAINNVCNNELVVLTARSF